LGGGIKSAAVGIFDIDGAEDDDPAVETASSNFINVAGVIAAKPVSTASGSERLGTNDPKVPFSTDALLPTITGDT
jgi:hypothetical protein